MAKVPDRFLKTNQDLFIKKSVMRLGGIVPLKTFLAINNPELLKRILVKTAKVEAKLDSNGGFLYLYINLLLAGGSYEELKVGIGDLEEGDIVDVNSIVVQFIDDGKGGAFLRYSAMYVEDNKHLPSTDEIKQFLKNNFSELLDCIKDFTKWFRKRQIQPKQYQDSYDCYEDTSNRELWLAMTDGQDEDFSDEDYWRL